MAEGHETRAELRASRAKASPQRTTLSPDRFDELEKSGRVGAHRVVGKPRRFWIYLVSALLGVAVLTAVGVVVIQMTGASLSSLQSDEKPAETEKPQTVQAVLDPTAPVVVLNGTTMDGFSSIVDGIITENAWGQILFSGPAASSDVQISAVFYSAEEDQPAALALAKELGGVSVFQSSDYDEYGARLVVLLGSDYAGPGSDQLVLEEVAAE